MNPLLKANAPSIPKPRLWQTITLTTALVAVANPVFACGGYNNPTPIPPPVWIINHPGTNDIWIGSQLSSLFAPTALTHCACGATILPNGVPLPSSFQITGAEVTISPADNSSMGTELVDGFGNPIFNFSANSTVSSAIAGNPSAVPGQTWNGFQANVNPFTPSTLPSDQIYKLWFKAKVDQNQLSETLGILGQNPSRFQFASGTIDDPNHPISFTGPAVPAVPEPSAAISLLGLAGLMLLQGRRKS